MAICSLYTFLSKIRRSIHLLVKNHDRRYHTTRSYSTTAVISRTISVFNQGPRALRGVALCISAAILLGSALDVTNSLALDDQSQRSSSKTSVAPKKAARKQMQGAPQPGKDSNSKKTGSFSKTAQRKGGQPAKGAAYAKKSGGSALTLQQLEQQEPAEHSSELEEVGLDFSSGIPKLNALPRFNSRFAGRVAAITEDKHFVFFSVDPELQDTVSKIIRRVRGDHVAIVVTEPSTGRVLAIGGRSISLDNPITHAGFPAASLFKVVTAAAAVERGTVAPDTSIRFRGGDYTLGLHNYSPDPRKDQRTMTITEALGKSCNPVFGRIALNHLTPSWLLNTANRFGFNQRLECDADITPSRAEIPSDSAYELSRTAAGFGQVRISPIHAASMMAGIANDGLRMKTTFIDRIVSPAGVISYRSKPKVEETIVSEGTAKTVMEMMQATILKGTSRKEFMHRADVIKNMAIAAKTGTLSGDNPKGLNHWFIAAAPLENPRIALAVVVVNQKDSYSKASHLGKLIFEKFFQG